MNKIRNLNRGGRPAAIALLAAVMTLTAITGAPSARAHTAVAESDPADGSTVPTPPAMVTVRFGSLPVPFQPLAITDAGLAVIDACGAVVHQGEAEVDVVRSEVTIASGGEVSGRYEIHWEAQALDGASQAGALDFVVEEGAPCLKAIREDGEGDVDAGFDPVMLSSTPGKRGAVVSVTLADAPTCTELAATAEESLNLVLDTNYDEEPDLIGTFGCAANRLTLSLAEPSAEEGDVTAVIPVKRVGAAGLSVLLRKSIAGDTFEHIDVYVEASTESSECGDEDICLDRAPDLGSLRSF